MNHSPEIDEALFEAAMGIEPLAAREAFLDARGRPLALPKAADKRYEALVEWQTRLGGG